MKKQDYTIDLVVNVTPEEAFKSINNVTQWWTENLEGGSHSLGDVFTVRFGDVHLSTQKIVELVPGKKVVWLVTHSKLTFIENVNEWAGTKISFEIAEKDNKTAIRFMHEGLVPGIECYKGCSAGWTQYVKGSLFQLLTEGKGKPGVK